MSEELFKEAVRRISARVTPEKVFRSRPLLSVPEMRGILWADAELDRLRSENARLREAVEMYKRNFHSTIKCDDCTAKALDEFGRMSDDPEYLTFITEEIARRQEFWNRRRARTE